MPSDRSPVILVTGASSGIGAATARLFGGRGYRVFLAARREGRLAALAAEIAAAGGQADYLAVDLNEGGAPAHLAETVLTRCGQVDVLFNNAGFGRIKWLEQLEPQADITAMVQVNLLAPILLTRVLLPSMIARRQGHIINMSSVAGWVATPSYSVYAATKFGLRGFTEALRREVGIYGVRVSGIYPGGTATEFTEHAGIQRKTGLRTPKAATLSAAQVAEGVWRLVQRPRRVLILPRWLGLAVWLNRLAPGWLDWAIDWRYTRPEREG
jgi:short-subunit dehydrogenase